MSWLNYLARYFVARTLWNATHSRYHPAPKAAATAPVDERLGDLYLHHAGEQLRAWRYDQDGWTELDPGRLDQALEEFGRRKS